MKQIKQVELTPIFVDCIPEDLEDNILYISKRYATAVHNCLCGCRGKTITPIGIDWWLLTVHKKKVSLIPSIANNYLPCQSHYMITNNVANFIYNEIL